MSSMKGLEERANVFEVIERTILRDGQTLLIPEIEVAVDLTSLPDDPSVVIEFYLNSRHIYCSLKLIDVMMSRGPAALTRILVAFPGR